MLATPTVPVAPTSDFANLLGGFPLRLDLSPVALAIVLVLVCIVFAVMSVVLLYHWRRFPYEHTVFARVEHVYLTVSSLLLAVAVIALFLSA